MPTSPTLGAGFVTGNSQPHERRCARCMRDALAISIWHQEVTRHSVCALSFCNQHYQSLCAEALDVSATTHCSGASAPDPPAGMVSPLASGANVMPTFKTTGDFGYYYGWCKCTMLAKPRQNMKEHGTAGDLSNIAHDGTNHALPCRLTAEPITVPSSSCLAQCPAAHVGHQP